MTALDQAIGIGDGTKASFQLVKTYGDAAASTVRQIAKPVAGTVVVSVNGAVKPATAFCLRSRNGDRDVCGRAYSGERGERDGRLRIRRAGAVRDGADRRQPDGLQCRAHSVHSADGDHAMRTIDPALKAHLEGDATTLCHAWRVTRRDGVVLGFTEHDHDLGFDGTEFLAASGFSASATEEGAGLPAATSEVAGGFSSEAISEAELAARAL